MQVLVIQNVTQLKERLDDWVCQTYPIQDTTGRTKKATIVSEPGMYEVVIRSDKSETVPNHGIANMPSPMVAV
ncbi:hypothetical protein CH249_12555 [Rhodococcus sp. 05-2255-3B1]|nr:hypothetical protein CH250_21185 [Rhodococcus sp. 05-2255-3C]OZE10608.1 hypothetical protein CH249_12555 [Rhodococcus sp. 05-2255-3B1]OZE20683.1 hypothetical protein CH255_08725 [Rhodococcus sp. 05-2255-2A2]